ncbi:MAG: restriction endonuclease subunit S [Verrucomicrobiota bacterium]|jgi:type I restriction enzyme S subunit
MKKRWQAKALGEILQKTETVNPLSSPQTEFDYIDVSSVSNTTFQIETTQRLKGKNAPSRARKLVRMNDILFATIRPTLQRIAIVPENLDKQVCSTGYFVLRPNAGIDHRFVFYFLFTEDFTKQMTSLQKGASYPAVTDGDVRAQMIPVPPLAEQQRIVGLLDEAFAGIATAQSNAEKNLQNTRALFDSHLQSVFTQRGKGWTEKTIGECFRVRSGDFLPVRAMVDSGDIDVYGGNGVNGKHDKKNLTGENIIIGRVGAKCGNVRYVNGDLWVTDNAIFISEYFCPFNLKFLTRLLEHKDLRNRANQMAQPVISYTTIKDVLLEFPVSKDKQKEIADKLDTMEEETQRLASVYEQKLTTLGELKRSLLHQAFTGNL